MDRELYENHLTILRSELIMALGCTEPIAIAYAAAKARQILGEMPETCTVHCSGNIVKNVMGVTVPNSGGLKGIDVAATLGIVGGDPEMELAVLESVTAEDQKKVRELLDKGFCTCKLIENVATLYIVVELAAGEHTALVEIQKTHKNITRMEKDGVSLLEQTATPEEVVQKTGNRELLTVENIIEFAGEVKIEDIEPILSPQIECNMAICREGLENPYGAEDVYKRQDKKHKQERVAAFFNCERIFEISVLLSGKAQALKGDEQGTERHQYRQCDGKIGGFPGNLHRIK